VLVIVPDDTLRRLLSDVLTDDGFAVVTAGDGAHGVAAAQDVPDLVLLDVSRTGPAGLEFGAWYRGQTRPRAPLVLLSAGGLPELIVATEEMGAAGFLRLPFDLDDLLDLATRCISAETGRPALLGAFGAGPDPASKSHREGAAEAERRRRLRRLSREVGALRLAVARVRDEVHQLQTRSLTGRLTPDEAQRTAALRRTSEVLRFRLRRFERRFDRLQHEAEGGR
jgi:two-component system response regulator (stage 0 sporulation protein F)